MIVGCWDVQRLSGRVANARPFLLLTTRQQDHSSLSVVAGHLATNKANGDGGGGRRHTTAAHPAAANCCLPSACASADNTTLPPLPQMKSHYRHRRRLHVIVAAARAKERWFGAMRGHHRRAGPTSSPLDGAFELPSRSAKKSANSQPAIQLRLTAQQRGVRCGNIFSCTWLHALTWTE